MSVSTPMGAVGRELGIPGEELTTIGGVYGDGELSTIGKVDGKDDIGVADSEIKLFEINQ